MDGTRAGQREEAVQSQQPGQPRRRVAEGGQASTVQLPLGQADLPCERHDGDPLVSEPTSHVRGHRVHRLGRAPSRADRVLQQRRLPARARPTAEPFSELERGGSPQLAQVHPSVQQRGGRHT